MIKHKILEDNGIESIQNFCGDGDSRNDSWAREREIYGFDERETWGLDSAFAEWLFERLIRYKEVCNVNLNYHKGEHRGEVITQEQAIDKMIDLAKAYLQTDIWDEKLEKFWEELTELWSEWGLAMWW